MTEYDNNLTGVLFKNDRKEKETQPDYKGSSEIAGVEYWLSAWIKTGKNGNKFMSLAYTAKDQIASHNNEQKQTKKKEDDIPW